jgi:hydroxyacylglutathione hydrolase
LNPNLLSIIFEHKILAIKVITNALIHHAQVKIIIMLHIKKFTFSPIAENTYVVYNDAKEAAIIDPGCYFDNEKDLLKGWLDGEDLSVKYLLNTHCHLDHVFGNKFLAEAYNLNLHCHKNEELLLTYAPTSGLKYNLPFDNYTGKLNFIDETNTITLGQDVLKIFFTPGHSPGSISFYAEKEKFIVSGDVLFQESVGRTDLPGGSMDVLLASIRTQLFTLPADVVVYSGHGEETTIGYEIKNNPFLK